MSASEYYRVHVTPRMDTNHPTGVWVNFLLEIEPSAQGKSMPHFYDFAAKASWKLYGKIPTSLTIHPVTADTFEKVLSSSDYHVVASAVYDENNPTPRTSIVMHTDLNGGEGAKVALYPPHSHEGKVYAFKDFWDAYSPQSNNCTIVVIKDR